MFTPLLFLASLISLPQEGASDFTVYDTVDTWSIVRRVDGCFMGATGQGPSPTDVMVFYDVTHPENPVMLLLSNPRWNYREETVAGYRIHFVGADRGTSGLTGLTFSSDGAGVVMIGFNSGAVPLLLTDFARSTAIRLYLNDTLLAEADIRGGQAALRRVMACARTFQGRQVPRYPFEGN